MILPGRKFVNKSIFFCKQIVNFIVITAATLLVYDTRLPGRARPCPCIGELQAGTELGLSYELRAAILPGATSCKLPGPPMSISELQAAGFQFFPFLLKAGKLHPRGRFVRPFTKSLHFVHKKNLNFFKIYGIIYIEKEKNKKPKKS